MRLIKEVLETKNEMRELVAKNILPKGLNERENYKPYIDELE